MKKVVVLGNSGMLGHMVSDVLSRDDFELCTFDRSILEIRPRTLNQLGVLLSKFCGFDADYVINCIGAIKPTFKTASSPVGPIYTNAIFPHQLATWCNLTDTKLIHITTDCVYDGAHGNYVESDLHNALDDYGKSKSLGEPPSAMVIRTSIIGPEIGGRKRSLLEWIKGQENKQVNGFVNHLWNGVTTLELSRCLSEIVRDDWWAQDLFHVFGETIYKSDMVQEISDQYSLEIDVTPVNAPVAIDRTLGTEKCLQGLLSPLDFSTMIDDLVGWERDRRR